MDAKHTAKITGHEKLSSFERSGQFLASLENHQQQSKSLYASLEAEKVGEVRKTIISQLRDLAQLNKEKKYAIAVGIYDALQYIAEKKVKLREAMAKFIIIGIDPSLALSMDEQLDFDFRNKDHWDESRLTGEGVLSSKCSEYALAGVGNYRDTALSAAESFLPSSHPSFPKQDQMSVEEIVASAIMGVERYSKWANEMQAAVKSFLEDGCGDIYRAG